MRARGLRLADVEDRPAPSRAALLFGLLFLCFGLLGVVGSGGAYLKDTGIERAGVSAPGHVTGKRILASADGDSDHLLEYWFLLPDGRRLEVSRDVPTALWKATRKGDVIEVLYSTQQPNRNFPRGAGVTSLGVVLFVAGLASVFAVFGAMLLIGWHRIRAATRLAAH